jgi:polysaccharide biosynthesis/export protein
MQHLKKEIGVHYGLQLQVGRLCHRIPSRFLLVALTLITLAGCSALLPSAGPSAGEVKNAPNSHRLKDIKVIDLNNSIVSQLSLAQEQTLFSNTFRSEALTGNVIGAGDVIEVSIWEVPPALFSGLSIDPRAQSGATHVTTFPEQVVSNEGTINIPFAGQIYVAGCTLKQIEAEIVFRLKGKANQPQVLVRSVSNNTTNVIIVGDVAKSVRMPLTAKRERLLDALAAAGGVRQTVNKTTLQLTRGKQVQSMPLDMIIRDPKQNIILLPDDIITLLFQPLSFTALGATGKNEEINFEAPSISLAQALARAGGLTDSRANARGVFIFRYETYKAIELASQQFPPSQDGKVPVIYRVNIKDPASFFIAQNFQMHNKDILFVSNAPSADFQKFLNMVVSIVYPVVNVINAVP